jgi:hypothetical protein
MFGDILLVCCIIVGVTSEERDTPNIDTYVIPRTAVGGEQQWLVLKSMSQIFPLIQIPKENISQENSHFLKNIIDLIALSLNDSLNCTVVDANHYNFLMNHLKSKVTTESNFIPNRWRLSY